MISYAQNFEDVMINRVFKGMQNGFYIDVGAWHPTRDSVTRHFYDLGWHGINIEAAKKYASFLQRKRRRDTTLNVAVSNYTGEASFTDVPGTGISSLLPASAEFADRLGFASHSKKTAVTTLEKICDTYCVGKTIHFLKIDVEGAERNVIEGMNWKTYRPILLLVEAVKPGTQDPAWEDWEPLLLDSEYEFVWFDGLNRFYLRREDIGLRGSFTTPPNCFDGFELAEGHACRKIAQFPRKLLGQFFSVS